MVSAILLAAGESKRLKGENKLIKILNKKHLINHSIKALVISKVDKIIVVLGYQSNKVKKCLCLSSSFIQKCLFSHVQARFIMVEILTLA